MAHRTWFVHRFSRWSLCGSVTGGHYLRGCIPFLPSEYFLRKKGFQRNRPTFPARWEEMGKVMHQFFQYRPAIFFAWIEHGAKQDWLHAWTCMEALHAYLHMRRPRVTSYLLNSTNCQVTQAKYVPITYRAWSSCVMDVWVHASRALKSTITNPA